MGKKLLIRSEYVIKEPQCEISGSPLNYFSAINELLKKQNKTKHACSQVHATFARSHSLVVTSATWREVDNSIRCFEDRDRRRYDTLFS